MQENRVIPKSDRERELIALFEIGKAVNSTLDLDEALDLIIRETLRLFSAQAGSVMLADSDGVLRIKSARGLSDEIIQNTHVRPGEGIAGWVFETGEPVLLDGKVSDARFVKVIDRKEQIASSMTVPLKSRGKTIGVLMIRRSGPTRYTEWDRKLIVMIADHIAVAIENASLFEKEIERARELEKLYNDLSIEKLKIETILSSMADGVVVTNPEGRVILVNRAASRFLKQSESSIHNSDFDDVFPEQCRFSDINDSLFTKELRYKSEIELNEEGADEMNLRVLATAMKREDREVEGIVVVLQNITEMKRIDRMKNEFVSMVSHELRTPLTSIQGFAELMKIKDFEKDRRDHYLGIILNDSGRLMRLINNLLDLSRLEAGQIIFNLEPLHVNELVPEILKSFEGQAENHNLVFEPGGNIPLVLLDRDMFANIITNLVSNAIKYSPDGGKVTVGTEKDGGVIRVSVKDEGIGLAPDVQDKVFDKFFRVDSSLTRETGGTGLGLATVKYIVEGFGGKIWVESELEKGSKFIFTIPLED